MSDWVKVDVPSEEGKEKVRLTFNHSTYSEDDKATFQNSGVSTYAMQGKIFYGKDGIYTQSRNDLPKRMIIRGEELKQEDYVPLLEKFPTFGEYTNVFMVSKQDLLITHKKIDGVQVFFLGVLDSDGKFTPASVAYKTNEEINKFCVENDIHMVRNYGFGGNIYIPAQIETEAELDWVVENMGSFVHTVDGVPTTYSTAEEDQKFEMFSDSQNNLQLFIRLFFISHPPTSLEDLKESLGFYQEITPENKVIDFVSYIEWFKEFLKFFSKWQVCTGLVHGTSRVYLKIEEGEEERMKKPVETLASFIRNVRWQLKQNKKLGNVRDDLHVQVEKAIYSFFCYPNNLNNCCHLLKHRSRLAVSK